MKQKQQERPGGTLAITSKGARLTSRNGDQWQGQQRRNAEQNIFVLPSSCWQPGADVLADSVERMTATNSKAGRKKWRLACSVRERLKQGEQ